MSELTIGLLSALLATNQPQAVSNLVQQQTGISLPVADRQRPGGKGIARPDDRRRRGHGRGERMDQHQHHRPHRTTPSRCKELNQRIRARFDVVKQGYENFLRNHPDSAHGFLAYGSFLNDIGDEDGAKVQYENSRQLDPKNPAVWNQLANYYGEYGGLTNAFADYAEAIRLDPTEPVYYQNFATTVYLFRKDAREFYASTSSRFLTRRWGFTSRR